MASAVSASVEPWASPSRRRQTSIAEMSPGALPPRRSGNSLGSKPFEARACTRGRFTRPGSPAAAMGAKTTPASARAWSLRERCSSERAKCRPATGGVYHALTGGAREREEGMDESPYWNPRHETMPREGTLALQVRKLRSLVDWADAQVPWQAKRLRNAGVTADSIRTIDDLRRIPLMTRDEWMEGQLDEPPYGTNVAAPKEAAIRYHMTSGTTGKTPIRVLDGMKDWEWIAEMWCYGLWGFGVRPADTVFVAFGYSTFIGFWGLHYAGEKIGCLTLPGGALTTEQRVRQIEDMGATVVCSRRKYALRMVEEAKQLGIDLAAGPVQRLIRSEECRV